MRDMCSPTSAARLLSRVIAERAPQDDEAANEESANDAAQSSIHSLKEDTMRTTAILAVLAASVVARWRALHASRKQKATS